MCKYTKRYGTCFRRFNIFLNNIRPLISLKLLSWKILHRCHEHIKLAMQLRTRRWWNCENQTETNNRRNRQSWSVLVLSVIRVTVDLTCGWDEVCKGRHKHLLLLENNAEVVVKARRGWWAPLSGLAAVPDASFSLSYSFFKGA